MAKRCTSLALLEVASLYGNSDLLNSCLPSPSPQIDAMRMVRVWLLPGNMTALSADKHSSPASNGGRERRHRGVLGCVYRPRYTIRLLKAEMCRRTEDQQRINTFSKLNARARTIEEKLEELKVRSAPRPSCHPLTPPCPVRVSS